MKMNQNQPAGVPAPPSRRILVVEDDPSLRELSAAALSRAGYRVDTAEETQAGWAALQSHTYDLVITDNQMPGVSGVEFVRMLRAAQLRLPVIFASGGVNGSELSQSEWLQPAVALPKPFTADQLLETVAGVLTGAVSVQYHQAIAFPSRLGPYDHWGLNE